MLNDVKKALKELDPLVFYGMAPSILLDDDGKEVHTWDYTVFNRSKLRNHSNKTSYSDRFEVHIVREEYIPEDVEMKYIAKLTALPGVKLAEEDGSYDYTMKPGTDTVVEALTLTFTRGRK